MRGTSLASLAACLGLTLGGCAIPPSSPYASLAYQQVAPGWTLTLHEPLRIPANQAHADIQAVGSGEMDPYCEFEIDTVSESPQTVEPDVFEVWRVGRSISPSSDWGMSQPVQLAAVGISLGTGVGVLSDVGIGIGIGGGRGSTGVGIGIGIGDGYGGWWSGRDPPTQLFYKTRLWLRSAKQPGVRQVTCQWDQMTPSGAAYARHLTLEEIRRALGPAFTLAAPGGSPRP